MGAASRRTVAEMMVTCPKTHDPATSVEEIVRLFENEHVHMALVVRADGILLTAIERSDLLGATSATSVSDLGSLVGRTVGSSDPLESIRRDRLQSGRRRMAVVDNEGRLLGLLCLKRDRRGFCSDEGVRARARERMCEAVPREADEPQGSLGSGGQSMSASLPAGSTAELAINRAHG